jgi:hypothetical protein
VSYLQPNGITVTTKKLLGEETLTKMGLRDNVYHMNLVRGLRERGEKFYPYEEDERFSELDKLVRDYSRTDMNRIERKSLETRLYDLIILLMSEHRIKGKFGLQPYRDWELEKLKKRMDGLGRRLNLIKRTGISP